MFYISKEPNPPNIILIVADDLGYNDLACYGQKRISTPNTDKMAQEGVRLTHAYSPSAVCSPTRYAIVTGTDPYRSYHDSHVLFNGEPLIIKNDELTVASLLKEYGYVTGVIGKWHLGLGDSLPRDLNNPGRGPNDIGFDYSFLIPDGHNMYPKYYTENGKVVGGIDPPFLSKVTIIDRVGYKLLQSVAVGIWENRRPDDKIGGTLADKVDDFIEKNRDKRFFLYYPASSIHFPIVPDSLFVGKSNIGAYGDFVMEFDWEVGRVMSTLNRLGISDNTLLVVTSDNGGVGEVANSDYNPNYPLRGHKGDAWEGGCRIPFIARWPGHISSGSVSNEPISLVDILATVSALNMGHLPSNAALDSFDMLPVLTKSNGKSIRPYLVTGTRGMQELAIHKGSWKLILAPESNNVQLFNLAKDPYEHNDVSNIQPKELNELRGLLIQYLESGSLRPGAKGLKKSVEELYAERDKRNQLIEDKFGGIK